MPTKKTTSKKARQIRLRAGSHVYTPAELSVVKIKTKDTNKGKQ